MMLPQYFTLRLHLLCLTTLLSIVLIFSYCTTPTQAVPLLPGEIVVERRRYCSTNLNDAIRLICGGRYNSLARNFPESVGSSRRTATLKRFADDGVFYRPLQSGPIHECCRRPCGYAELKLYCAPD